MHFLYHVSCCCAWITFICIAKTNVCMPRFSYNGEFVCVCVRACMCVCVCTAKTFMYHNLQLHNYQVEQNNARFNTASL